jgi:hypothetical protein
VADEPAEEPTEAPAKPKYKRPPTIGDKRRSRSENPELEMIAQLGSQAQEILRLAGTVEKDESFRKFADYLLFREKVSEFEAFCNVIEAHLKEIVSDRKQELEDRFYSLWSMIFRPSLRALKRFFDRLIEEDVLPLGGKDLLESEIRALQSMRTILEAPRFAAMTDQSMVADLDALESVISQLADRATSLPDFSNRPTVNSLPDEPRKERSAPAISLVPQAPRPEPERAPTSDSPNVRAVNELKNLLNEYKRDKGLQRYVEIDTRAVDEIERKFVANPFDPAAIVWLRQICNAWSSRLHNNDKDISRLLAMIRNN